jgi:hypothetical protein
MPRQTTHPAQGRPHHRGHAAARPAEAIDRRGAGHRPHPPPNGGDSRILSSDSARSGAEFTRQTADDVSGTPCNGAAAQGAGAEPAVNLQMPESTSTERGSTGSRARKSLGAGTSAQFPAPRPHLPSLFSVPAVMKTEEHRVRPQRYVNFPCRSRCYWRHPRLVRKWRHRAFPLQIAGQLGFWREREAAPMSGAVASVDAA